MSGPFPLSEVAALGELIDAGRGVRTRDDLAAALERIAAAAAAAARFATVVVDLHRPAWDDFEAVTVHGTAELRRELLATSSTWARWAPVIAPPFERRGAHHALDAELAGAQHPGPWTAGDVLLVVLRRADGDVLGLLRAADPLDGRRPDDAQVDALVLHARLAALAAERAAQARSDADRRLALDGLASVAGRSAERRSRSGVLDDVCARVHDALGFQHVAVLVAEPAGALRPAATSGWRADDPLFLHPAMTLAQLSLLLQPAYERHGCYLVERAEAEALLDLEAPVHRSQRNGRGPYAWDGHWLLVPLPGPAHEPLGLLWADDPADRLLPSRERLQALRVLAGQAAATLGGPSAGAAAGVLTENDPLTGLPGRGVLLGRLRHSLQRVKRSDHSVALLFFDLDRFKAINDELGHEAGDELLRTIAARVDEGLRPGDTVARFGGDEFAVLCEDVDGPMAALEVAERLRETIAEPVPLRNGSAQVTASVGVALPDRPDRTAQELLQAADRAMYEAKAAGRDAARLASPGAGWP